MKRIWIEDQGVSPVIATILMVAITVVLAAVLYVMVIGFGQTTNNASAGSWIEVKALSQDSAIAEFGAFTGNIEPMNLRIYVSENGTDIGYISWSSNTDPAGVSWQDGPDGKTVTYFDYSPAGGRVNSGDYIKLFGLLPGSQYSLKMYNVATESVISAIGDDGTFVTP